MRMPSKPWRTRNVWSISLSAFFADLGYQSVLAGFPLFMVVTLKQAAWEYGLAMALSYGGGALFSLLGSRLGDQFGHRKVALIGNSFIPLLSLCALVASPIWAIGLLTGGWWSRNLRSPSRRVMLSESITSDEHRNTVFGFLHALDVGGGAAAAVFVILAISSHIQFKFIFLATAIPLAISTLLLTGSNTGTSINKPRKQQSQPGDEGKQDQKLPPVAKSIFLASALYGFTFYSIGFPVLTVAEKTGSETLGIVAFLVFQAFSAATGYLLAQRLGKSLRSRFLSLGLFGYAISALGAIVLILDIHFKLGTPEYLLGLAILGFALGNIETLEPSLISTLLPGKLSGRGFGSLSAARSTGLFTGNLIMGVLYSIGASWSYGYAAAVALIAAALVLGTSMKINPKHEVAEFS